MKLYSIETGYFKLDGGAMFGVVPKSIWHKLNPADDSNMCRWALRCLLIEDGSRLILVDTGIGTKQDAKFFGHYHLHGDETLSTSLQKVGFSVDDITDVVLTHLHFDHCGGALEYKGDKIQPTFPNALYWSNESHWQWATNPNPREKASFLSENIFPLQESGQLRFVKDKTSFGKENVDFYFLDGHTEKQMLPIIDYKGTKIVFCADLLPSIHHLRPPYVMSYDVRPLLTMEEKQRVLEKAAQEGHILFFEHDAYHEACTVKATEKGIIAEQILKISDL